MNSFNHINPINYFTSTELANDSIILERMFSILGIPVISKKRIINEYCKLFGVSNIKWGLSKDIKIIISFEKWHNNKNIQYKFLLINYPFNAPIIYVNNVILKNCLTMSSKHVTLLKRWKNIGCLCCNSCLTSIGWSANISFNQIITEIERLLEIINGIHIMEIIEIIKNKYLIFDIDIFSWIYA